MEGEGYRVKLDVYDGPMDLLLYLIRREEVDIYDIPIARITDQYLQYVDVLKQVDPELAGEFMVLAASLMEIKTRMLLPSAPPEQQAEDDLTVDPRSELVRRLLEYKAFKDAAGELKDAADVQAMRFGRAPAKSPEPRQDEVDLENVQLWDLLDAFDRLMKAIGEDVRETQIIYDDTPVELYEADIVDRLRRDGSLPFREIFAGRTGRIEIVGLFLALLELIRQRKITARQDANFEQILLNLQAEAAADLEEKGSPDRDPQPAQGEYVPERPRRQSGKDEDEHRREDRSART